MVAQTGKVVATAPIGAGVDGTAFDPAARDVFTSNADGTLTVIHEDSPDQYHVVQNVQTAPGGRNMTTTFRLLPTTASMLAAIRIGALMRTPRDACSAVRVS